MSQGSIGSITIDAWQGNPTLTRVVLADITPKQLAGSLYAWDGIRALPCEITTITLGTDADVIDTRALIFAYIGTIQTLQLAGSTGTSIFSAKIIDAHPDWPKQITSSEDSKTQLIRTTWMLELG